MRCLDTETRACVCRPESWHCQNEADVVESEVVAVVSRQPFDVSHVVEVSRSHGAPTFLAELVERNGVRLPGCGEHQSGAADVVAEGLTRPTVAAFNDVRS